MGEGECGITNIGRSLSIISISLDVQYFCNLFSRLMRMVIVLNMVDSVDEDHLPWGKDMMYNNLENVGEGMVK